MEAKWQTIDTAPKDGTAVLLFEPMEPKYRIDGFQYGPDPNEMLCMGVGTWHWPDMSEPFWADYHDLTRLMDSPTHWMPLPDPPEGA